MRYPCFHCLTQSSVDLKLDKKGRPYSVCQCCGVRAFIRNRMGLRGFKILAPELMKMWENVADGMSTQVNADREVATNFSRDFPKAKVGAF